MSVVRTWMLASIEHEYIYIYRYYAKIGRSQIEWLISAASSQLQTQQGSVRMIFIIDLIPARICNCYNIDAIWLNIIFATPAQEFVCWIIHMRCWSSITRLCCQDLPAQIWTVDTSICFVWETQPLASKERKITLICAYSRMKVHQLFYLFL